MSDHIGTVLVTGATGQQGGTTARHLLVDGWHVRAIVRDPATPAARDLARLGAELVRGDMDDRMALTAAMRGVHGVYSVQPAFIPPHFAEHELQRGLNVAEAACDAGVQHLVYASVGGADRNSDLPHWAIKWQVEQHIRSLGIPSTVLRPVMFMEIHADPYYGLTSEHAILRTVPASATVQLIALRDIGAFAALAFARPERYVGKALELAGDEIAPDHLVAAVNRATGRALPLPSGSDRPVDESRSREPRERPASFANWQADIPALREQHPDLMDFDTWLAHEGAAKINYLFNRPE
ncbi:NmrA/HSCARG family protein [Actinacidiphila glaucinigra]|uniref:NmrA/HSCARG family protein n=1 Tax=Actinacidiphila glaucinigra TaxID=235986 RepID=UPI0033AFF4A0